MELKSFSWGLTLILAATPVMAADSKSEAHVTQIIREVKILPAEAAARAAVLNDRVAEDTGVRTGSESRSELTFVDLTITRLGANSIFSFNKAGRNNQIDSGSILLRVPKDSGGGRIRSSAVTVAVTGTTIILESARAGRNRLFVLEGSARISLIKYPKQFQNLRAAQMVDVPPGATTIPPPTNFNISDLMKKHPLIRDFPPLPSQDLIVAASRQPPPPAPPPSGPNPFPFVPLPFPVSGGGVSGGGVTTGTTQNPPPSTQNPPTTTQPQPPTGPGKPPRGSLPPTAGTGNTVGPTKGPATPPPVITRTTPPGSTKSPGSSATGTTAGTTKRATPPPKRRTTTRPVQSTHQGPH